MAALYEYIIDIIWGEEEEVQVALEEDAADSLDEDVPGIMSTTALGSGSQLVIRKSKLAGKTSYKAVPALVIKDPEPKDNYDARVIAIILAPAGVIIGLLGSVMTVLAYTTVPGFPSEESVAFATYNYHVTLLGPLLIGIGVCCELMGLVTVLCTPHHRKFPMIYPKVEDDEETSQARTSSSRRVSIAPSGFQVTRSKSGTSDAQVNAKVITPGAQLAIMHSAHTVV